MAKIIKDTYLSFSSFIGTSNDDVYTFTINNWNNRDSFDGGDGFDTLQVNINATGTITIDLTDGSIGVNNSPSLPLIFNFENLDLRQYSNFGANIIGNNSNNLLIGTKQNDEFSLTEGGDVIDGDQGEDTLKINFRPGDVYVVRLKDSSLHILPQDKSLFDNDNSITVAKSIEKISMLKSNGKDFNIYSLDNFSGYAHYSLSSKNTIPNQNLSNSSRRSINLEEYIWSDNYEKYVGIKYTVKSTNPNLSDQISLNSGFLELTAGSNGEKLSSNVTITAELVDKEINIDENWSGSRISKTFSVNMADDDSLGSVPNNTNSINPEIGAINYNETESNDSLASANNIIAKDRIKGSLSNQSDVDIYKLDIDKDGFVQLIFKPEDSTTGSDVKWNFQFLEDIGSGVNRTFLTDINISDRYVFYAEVSQSNDYYVLIKPINFSSNPYRLYYDIIGDREIEANNSLSEATNLYLNSEFKGNLSLKNDIDFFKFTTSSLESNQSENKIQIKFTAPDTGTKDINYFSVSLYDSSGLLIDRQNVSSKEEIKINYTSSGGELFYIGVQPSDYFSSKDYKIKIDEKVDIILQDEPNDTKQDATEINLFSIVNGKLSTESDIDIFSFQIDDIGSVKLNFDPPVGSLTKKYYRLKVYDETDNILYGSNTGIEENIDIYFSEKGKYFFSIESSDYYSEKSYEFILSSSSNKKIEIEPNDAILEATVLSKGQNFKGQLSSKIDLDYYQFEIPDRGVITISVTSEDTFLSGGNYKAVIVSEDGYELTEVSVPSSTTGEASLAVSGAGKYFAYITSDYNYSSQDYTINFDYKLGQKGNNYSDNWEPNDSFSLSYPLISGNKVSAQISKPNDIDFYSINTANLNQLNIKFDIPGYAPGNSFYINIYDSDQNLIDSRLISKDSDYSLEISNHSEHYVEIKKGSNYFSDNYDITLTTAKIDLPIVNEEEPNQDFSQSMSIDEKTIIRSFLDNSSDIDTFSFIPSQAGYLFLTFDTANDYINNKYFLRLFSEDSNGFRTLVKAVSVGQDYKFSTRVTDQKKYYLNVQADSEQNFTSDIYEINYKIIDQQSEAEVSIAGTSQSETIQGTSKDDIIDPNSGNDIIKAGRGTDTVKIKGESSSFDIVKIPAIDNYVVLFGNAGAGKYTSQYKRLFDVEKIQFFDKTINLQSISNKDAPEIVLGSKNNEIIYGTPSNDFIDPIGGKHLIDGKQGNDTLLIFNSSENFNISTLENIVDIRFKDTNPHYRGSVFRLTNIEKIVFSDRQKLIINDNEAIFGTFASDTIRGTSGDDIIDPLGGRDKIYGGTGSDKVIFFNQSSDFTWTTQLNKTTIIGKDSALNYAGLTLQLYDIESLVFLDKTVSLELEAGITTNRDAFEIIEGGSSSTLSIALTRRPYNDEIEIKIVPSSADLSVSKDTIIFTQRNWMKPQNITFKAFDDSEIEGIENHLITLSISNDDPIYKNVLNKEISIKVNDNDKPPINLSGKVYNDSNEDGEKAGNEKGLEDWLIYIDSNANGEYDSGERTTTTDANGNYTFYQLDPGEYIIGAEIPLGWILTSPDRVGDNPINIIIDDSDEEYSTSQIFSPKPIGFSSIPEMRDLFGLESFRADSRFKDFKGEGYAVVIIDSGIDPDHPYFGSDTNRDGMADRIIYTKDWNTGGPITNSSSERYFSQRSQKYDTTGSHGTHVAGIAASEDIFYPGIAPDVNLIIFDVSFDSDDGLNVQAVFDSLDWVSQNFDKYNIVAVNLSLGNDNVVRYRETYDIADDLARKGVSLVISSGNSFIDGGAGVTQPGNARNAISVGSLFDKDYSNRGDIVGTIYTKTGPHSAYEIQPYSNRYPGISDIFAPGTIISAKDKRNPDDLEITGTSMAAPFITGVIPLLQGVAETYINRRLSFWEIEKIIKESGKTIYDGDDEFSGYLNGYNVRPTEAYYKSIDIYEAAKLILDLAPIGTWKIDLGEKSVSNLNFGFVASSTDVSSEDSDRITGSNRSDTIYGRGGNDVIFGLDGNDTLKGGPGDDILSGGNDNDKLYPDSGRDKIDGGNDIDTLYVSSYSNDITFETSEYGYRIIKDSFNYIDFKNIEKIQFTDKLIDASELISDYDLAPEFIGNVTSYSTTEGNPITVNLNSLFRDPEGDDLTYTISTTSSLIEFDSPNENIIFTPDDKTGNVLVNVKASDPIDQSISKNITFSSVANEITYSFNTVKQNIEEGVQYIVVVKASKESSVDTTFNFEIIEDLSKDISISNDDFNLMTGSFVLGKNQKTAELRIDTVIDDVDEGLESFNVIIKDSNGFKLSTLSGSIKDIEENEETLRLSDEPDDTKKILKGFNVIEREDGILNSTLTDDLIILTGGSYKTVRGLSGNDIYFVSSLLPKDSNIQIIDNSGNNLIQIPDNTFIVNILFSSDAIQLTLSDAIKVTVNGADNFNFELGGNYLSGDKGTIYNLAELSNFFGLDSLPLRSESAEQSLIENKWIVSEQEKTDEGYLLSNSYNQEKAILNPISSDLDFVGKTTSYTNLNDIIILTSNGVTYRGLDADDTYVISELITSDASISIVDNNGKNSIQVLDNTRIVSSKWTSDAVKLTLTNNIDITINGADEFSFNIGGNITTNDKGNTLTFAQFSEIFGLEGLPDQGQTISGADNGYII